ncbi:UDP-N-acetylglucosamine transferase subunit [Umbelopsis nana]
MIALVRDLDIAKYYPRTYVIANTDTLSEVKARKLEQDRTAIEGKDFFVHRIPRLREVGQPLATVPFSVVKALLGSVEMLYNMPDLVVAFPSAWSHIYPGYWASNTFTSYTSSHLRELILYLLQDDYSIPL